MSWLKVMEISELPSNMRKVIKVETKNVLVINHHDKIHAVENSCPHLGLSLKKATVDENCTLTCPWHRSQFDLNNGNVKSWVPWPPLFGKILALIKRNKKLTVYETKIEDNWLWVKV